MIAVRLHQCHSSGGMIASACCHAAAGAGEGRPLQYLAPQCTSLPRSVEVRRVHKSHFRAKHTVSSNGLCLPNMLARGAKHSKNHNIIPGLREHSIVHVVQPVVENSCKGWDTATRRHGVRRRTSAVSRRAQELEQHHLVGPGAQQGPWYIRGHLRARRGPVPAQVDPVHPNKALPLPCCPHVRSWHARRAVLI